MRWSQQLLIFAGSMSLATTMFTTVYGDARGARQAEGLHSGHYSLRLAEKRVCNLRVGAIAAGVLVVRQCGKSDGVGLKIAMNLDPKAEFFVMNTLKPARKLIRALGRSMPYGNCGSFLTAPAACSDTRVRMTEEEQDWKISCQVDSMRNCTIMSLARGRCPKRYLGFPRSCDSHEARLYAKDDPEAITRFRAVPKRGPGIAGFKQVLAAPNCKEDRLACNFHEECCLGFCNANSQCGCYKAGDTCYEEGRCCEGLLCLNHKCQ